MTSTIILNKEIYNPEVEAGFWSRWTYEWLTPLLKVGAKRPLQPEDMYDLSNEYEASNVHDQFEKAFKEYIKDKDIKDLRQNSAITLFRILFNAFGADFLKAGFYMLLQTLLNSSSPVLIYLIIFWLQDFQQGETVDPNLPYILSATLFVFQLLTTLYTNWSYELKQRTGFRFRTALTMALYQKSFRLSPLSRQEFSAGKIVNISATETNRLDASCQMFHILWSAPLLVVITTGYLIWIIGPCALIGFGIIILYFPVQHFFSSILTAHRRASNYYADKRIRTIQEVINGMRIIKMYAWEKRF